MSWKASAQLKDTIRHYANFPATGVSLRQMVQFGERPSIGMREISQPCFGFLPWSIILLIAARRLQVHYFAPPNSSPKSSPFDLRTASKS